MGVYIVGFIVAVVLAAIVLALIAYCMFVKERHKSELHQYNISDLKHRNLILSGVEDKKVEKEVTAGVIFIPTRRKHKDEDYHKRPDYPESPAPVTPSTDRLVEILGDIGSETDAYKDGIYEVDRAAPSSPTYQSDV